VSSMIILDNAVDDYIDWDDLPQFPVWPRIVRDYVRSEHKCMFEGLPPGVYGIACPCPKCTPTC